MSSIRTVAKSAAEKVNDFNKRLLRECAEMPVTRFEATLADGEPVITLISEIVEVDQEMLDEAGKGSGLRLGERVPESDPIDVQILRIGTAGDGAALAEQHTSVLNKRSEGAVEEVRYVQGLVTDWMRDRNDFDANGKEIVTTPRWVRYERQAVYCVIAYLVAFEDDTEDAKAPELAAAGKKK